MKYLGFLVTRDEVKPTDKNTINKNMKPPTSRKEVHKFIGVANYYRDVWSRRSHLVVPLTNIKSSKVKFKWTKTEQDDFKEIKRIVPSDILLAYPYFNEQFNEQLKIITNTSHFQLGAFIIQNGMPIVFYRRKLTGTQKSYTVT